MYKNFSDPEFLEELHSYLDAQGDESVVPVFYKESSAVDREKTLSLACFDGMTEQKKRELCQ